MTQWSNCKASEYRLIKVRNYNCVAIISQYYIVPIRTYICLHISDWSSNLVYKSAVEYWKQTISNLTFPDSVFGFSWLFFFLHDRGFGAYKTKDAEVTQQSLPKEAATRMRTYQQNTCNSWVISQFSCCKSKNYEPNTFYT